MASHLPLCTSTNCAAELLDLSSGHCLLAPALRQGPAPASNKASACRYSGSLLACALLKAFGRALTFGRAFALALPCACGVSDSDSEAELLSPACEICVGVAL